ncbi:MAG: DUF6786 family protein [Cytophagales bacterium]|nr:DUF6786 family protein [Cytophagales bacterium]
MYNTTILTILFLFIITHAIGQNFGKTVTAIKKYQTVTILKSADSTQQVAICAHLQARVMTSTLNGSEGNSLGWVNLKHIASRTLTPHINLWGGEERIWFGPEGGQYALYFKKGDKFEYKYWQVPSAIDTEPFTLIKATNSKAHFIKDIKLKNYTGYEFSFRAERLINLITESELKRILPNISNNIRWVGYESRNIVRNTGSKAWSQDKGLISIWIMGMYPAHNQVVAIFPTTMPKPTPNIDYFQPLDTTRLKLRDSTLFFKTDGKYRSKIGLDYTSSKNVIGSYDAKYKLLTVIIYNLPAKPMPYVKSTWKYHEKPYEGDVTNSYNDGEAPMYELETSSPALQLKAGESYLHIQKTLHFQGSIQELDAICKKLLGVSIHTIPFK